jgi:hypothetical protein
MCVVADAFFSPNVSLSIYLLHDADGYRSCTDLCSRSGTLVTFIQEDYWLGL